jgi:hypothetical protein
VRQRHTELEARPTAQVGPPFAWPPAGQLSFERPMPKTRTMAAESLTLQTLWSAAGVVAGFQVAAFTWRITREIKMSDERESVWLPLADLLNLLSLGLTLIGVFAATALGLVGMGFTRLIFGWSVVLLACWPMAVAGHYELFNRRPRQRPAPYATRQEVLAVGAAVLLSAVYWLIAITA